MKQEVVVAVIGLGRIGKKHAEVLVREVPNCRVKYAVDVFLNDAMRAWAQELGIEQTTADANDALRDPEVDAVYICTSTGTHSAYITLAAQAGKHIFCEKPLDSDLERLYAALREVEKAGVKFQTGFMRRFDTNHNKVKQTLYSGEVGTPQMIRLSCRDNVQSPSEYLKVSGGIFFDMMIHEFDMVRFLSNSEVREAYATGGCYVDPRLNEIPDVDTAVAVLKLENGMIAVIDVLVRARPALRGLLHEGHSAGHERQRGYRRRQQRGGHPHPEAAGILPRTLRGCVRQGKPAVHPECAGGSSRGCDRVRWRTADPHRQGRAPFLPGEPACAAERDPRALSARSGKPPVLRSHYMAARTYRPQSHG